MADGSQPNLIEKESESIQLQSSLKEVAIIKDQVSYDRAVQARVGAQAWIKEVNDTFDPIREAAHKAWKTVIAQRDKVVEPVERQLKQINSELVKWDNEQKRLQREEQMRLEAEARRKAEEERIAQAVHMEAEGVDNESIDEILDAPIVIETPVVAAPTYEKSSAVNFRETWSGEVTDLHKLVQFVAKNKMHMGLLKIDQPALNKIAQALKSSMDIPGVKAVSTKTAVSGRY